MRILPALLAFAFAAPAQAVNTYTFSPNAETMATCQRLGLVGEFQIRPDGSPDRHLLVFATGAEKSVKRKANGVYLGRVECAAGCFGFAETKLDLPKREFSYWNSIDRNPEICRGAVATN